MCIHRVCVAKIKNFYFDRSKLHPLSLSWSTWEEFYQNPSPSFGDRLGTTWTVSKPHLRRPGGMVRDRYGDGDSVLVLIDSLDTPGDERVSFSFVLYPCRMSKDWQARESITISLPGLSDYENQHFSTSLQKNGRYKHMSLVSPSNFWYIMIYC